MKLIHKRGICWGVLLLVYVVFLSWYNGNRKPISVEETEAYVSKVMEQFPYDLVSINRIKDFCKSDSGNEIYIINLVNEKDTASHARIDAAIGKSQIKNLLKKAGHPIIISQDVTTVVESGGDHLTWDNASIVRYRSRRDFLDVITSETYQAHQKINGSRFQNFVKISISPKASLFLGVKTIVFILLFSIGLFMSYQLKKGVKSKDIAAIKIARVVIFLLAFIHLILPYTPINQHDGFQILIGAGIIGVCFLVLAWKSYHAPRKYFILALVILWGVILLAALTGASPIHEGLVIKLLFSIGLLGGIWQSIKGTSENDNLKYQ